MDTNEVKKLYADKLPSGLQNYINDLKSLGLKITLQANFSKDVEQSLNHGTNIYKGMQVVIPPNYKLSSKDKKWFHPDLFRSRSLQKIGEQNKLQLENFSSVVGTYYRNTVSDLGDVQQEKFGIVDIGIQDHVTDLWNSFFEGKTISEAYTKLMFTKIDGSTLSNLSMEKAKSYINSDVLRSYKYNMLYKGNGSYHFYNHVMKPIQGKALVHISPLIGFYEIDTSSPVSSDLLSQQDYININALKKDQRQRVFSACNWEGNNVVNTFTMRKPIEGYRKFIQNNVVYRNLNSNFSATNLSDKLPLDVILFLTPEAHNIPDEKVNQFHSDVKNNLIRMKATKETLEKLIPFYKELLKSNLMDGDDLVLSRDLAKKL